METFNFRFENTPFFEASLNATFSNAEDLKQYFAGFISHYRKFESHISPKSEKRMAGKAVENYQALHTYFQRLSDHYRLLLTVGTNGFDIWLNDFLPATSPGSQKKKTKKR